MGNARFSDEFKRDAVRQMTERGYPVAEVSQRLGYSSLVGWRSVYASMKVPTLRQDARIPGVAVA